METYNTLKIKDSQRQDRSAYMRFVKGLNIAYQVHQRIQRSHLYQRNIMNT